MPIPGKQARILPSIKVEVSRRAARDMALREQVERGIKRSRQKSETHRVVEELLRKGKMNIEQLVEKGVPLRKALTIVRAHNAIKELMSPAFYSYGNMEHRKSTQVLGAVLYGSVLKDTETASDIDICIFTTRRDEIFHEEEYIENIMKNKYGAGVRISLSVVDIEDLSEDKETFLMKISGTWDMHKILFSGDNIVYTRNAKLRKILNALRKKPAEYNGGWGLESRTLPLKYIIKSGLKSQSDIRSFQKTMFSLVDILLKDDVIYKEDIDVAASLRVRMIDLADTTTDPIKTKRQMLYALTTIVPDIRGMQRLTGNRKRVYEIIKDLVEHNEIFISRRP